MLITTCSHCQARFRVTPQQLNARQGQVRCGKCSQVFNGFQVLERFPDDDTGGRLLAEHERRELGPRTQPLEPVPAAEPAPAASATNASESAVDLPLFDQQPALEPAPQ